MEKVILIVFLNENTQSSARRKAELLGSSHITVISNLDNFALVLFFFPRYARAHAPTY